jgi:hypothetical protein
VTKRWQVLNLARDRRLREEKARNDEELRCIAAGLWSAAPIVIGKPMRAAIGGGKAVIGSNVKVAAAGASLDVPLGHKDDSWSFPHFDMITVSVADAPRPEEILVINLRSEIGLLELALPDWLGAAPIPQPPAISDRHVSRKAGGDAFG